MIKLFKEMREYMYLHLISLMPINVIDKRIEVEEMV